MQKWLWACVLALLVSFGLFGLSDPAHAGGDTRIRIDLIGTSYNGSIPKGSAEYRVKGTRTSLNADVSGLNVPEGTFLTARINGQFLIQLYVSLGSTGMELDSKHGFARQIRAGDVLTIAAPDGTLLVSGRF